VNVQLCGSIVVVALINQDAPMIGVGRLVHCYWPLVIYSGGRPPTFQTVFHATASSTLLLLLLLLLLVMWGSWSKFAFVKCEFWLSKFIEC